LLYDSAGRISEVLNLKIKDVVFDRKDMALINLKGKTGERKIRIIKSVPSIKLWLNNHPFKNDPEAPLFTSVRTKNYEAISPTTVDQILKDYGKRIGLKRIHAHMFRHTRLTELAPKITEAVMRDFAGWEKDSTMPKIYFHLSAEEIDIAIRNAEGVPVKETKKEIEDKTLESPKCVLCGNVENNIGDTYCSKCGSPLDKKKLKELDTIIKEGDKIAERVLFTRGELRTAVKEMIKEELKK